MTIKEHIRGRVSRIGVALAVAAALVPAAVGSLVTGAQAQSAIKILVNNDPITTYDIRNRTKFIQLITGGKQGEQRAIKELIDERLKLQEAKLRNVSISKSRIDGALETMAKRSNMTTKQLEAALRQSGVDPDTVRERIKADMAWNEILRARFQATVQISETEIAAAVGSRGEAPAAAVSQYDLQPIIFVIPKNASKAYEDQRKSEASAFRSRFSGCDTSIQLAKGLKDVVVENMLRRDETQFPDDVRETMAAASVGTATPPMRTAQGFRLFGICDKRTIQGASKASGEVRDELRNERGEMMARRYLRDLRSDALIDYR